MTTYRPRTDPARIRVALAYAETHTVNQTVIRFGLSHRSVSRWIRERATVGPQWPTLDMDREWLATLELRQRQAARLRRYRNALYLNGGQPLLVDPTGTRRRIQALMTMGWSSPRIAAHGHWTTGEAVLEIARRDRVTATNRDLIARIYDQLCMIPGPSAATRARARLEGYPPPLAWDDIDDPAEQPTSPARDTALVDDAVVTRILAGDVVAATHPERVEVARRWAATGRPLCDLALLTGWKVERYHRLAAS
ncbi:MAG: helix-turn-helix domain-containing protein [Nocardioides sp.]